MAGHRGVVTWVIVCALTGGLAAGCSGGDGDAAPSVPAEPTVDGAPVDEAPEPRRRGPIDELLAAIQELGTESPAAQLARLERTEAVIAACMREQGFEYTPMDWAAGLAAQREREATWDSAADATEDPVAVAAEFGYGLTVPWTDAEPEPTEDFFVDPNAERVAAMSTAEEKAWYLALWGPGQGEAYIEGDEPYDWTRYGCSGRGSHEDGTDGQVQFDDSAWSGLREEIMQLEASVPDDERLLGVHQEWSACMKEAGYPGYADPRDPPMEISLRSQEIWEQASAGVNLDLSTDDYLTSPEYLQQQADVARLNAELAPVEIALAVADATCRVEVDYDRRYAETWIARQEEYYDAHRADLDAWLAAAQEFEAAHG